MGTPDSTSTSDVRRYLKEFLSDSRVIEIPNLIWQIILNAFILPFRPAKTVHAYQQIWMKETNESPLRYYTRQQAAGVQSSIRAEYGESVIVDWAMRYGNPSIASRIDALTEAGCHRLVVLPLYPQYSATTTASVGDAVFQKLMKMRWQPAIRIIEPYESDPLYIEALAKSIEGFLKHSDWQPDTIIASFHGIPQRYFDAGDPYYCFCHKTARLLRERLGFQPEQLRMTFQSRFGKATWLQPYTDQTFAELAQSGMKKIAVIAPGFSSDCIETLEELNIRGRETFMQEGGTHFEMIPCLNDSDESIQLLTSLVKEALSGWL